jgi:hypothetical protein
MLCYEQTAETRNFKISLCYLLPFHPVTWNNFGRKFARKKVFYTQKKMTGTKRKAFCWELFKNFNILPLASESLLSLLSYVVDNMGKFQINSDIHSISARYRYKLHVPYTNLKLMRED